jgi:hypothetical protein
LITLARHPAVQKILDDWQQLLPSRAEKNKRSPTGEDLRKLIAQLEEALGITADQLDAIGAHSFKGLLRMNWKWITHRFHAITSRHRHL